MDTESTMNFQPKKRKLSKPLAILSVVILVAVIPLVIIFSDIQQESSQLIPDQRIVTITYSDNGFDPEHVQIPLGSKVLWVNDDTETNKSLQIISNAGSLELENFGSNEGVGLKGTYEYEFSQQGTVTYHNVFQPEHNGTIEIVKD